jgi:hypothetical protein
MALERKGIPTATLITHVFEDYARGLARMQGMKALPIVTIPHPVAARSPEELRSRIRSVQAQIRAALLLD